MTVKSLRWPGAINAYVNGETYFFYFGNGMKTEDNNNTDFSYQKFPKIPDDIPDKVDQEEPHDDSNNPNPAENKEEKKEEEKNEG